MVCHDAHARRRRGDPGLPVRTLALLLVFSIGIVGVITPYATAPAPVYHGCGYIGRRDFCRLGFIFGLIAVAAPLRIGLPTFGEPT